MYKHTKRDELSFLTVFAFPKLSRIGEISSNICSTLECLLFRDAKKRIINFCNNK